MGCDVPAAAPRAPYSAREPAMADEVTRWLRGGGRFGATGGTRAPARHRRVRRNGVPNPA